MQQKTAIATLNLLFCILELAGGIFPAGRALGCGPGGALPSGHAGPEMFKLPPSPHAVNDQQVKFFRPPVYTSDRTDSGLAIDQSLRSLFAS